MTFNSAATLYRHFTDTPDEQHDAWTSFVECACVFALLFTFGAAAIVYNEMKTAAPHLEMEVTVKS